MTQVAWLSAVICDAWRARSAATVSFAHRRWTTEQ